MYSKILTKIWNLTVGLAYNSFRATGTLTDDTVTHYQT